MDKFFGIIVLIFVSLLLILVSQFGYSDFGFKAVSPKEAVLNETSNVIRPLPVSPAPLIQQQPAVSTPVIQPAKPAARFGYVSVSGVPVQSSVITLNSDLQEGETVNITGWRVKSNHGDFIIPQAVAIYEPSGFSQESDIILRAGDQISIYSSFNSLGKNFRLNKCFGYLQGVYNFDPAPSLNCPYPYNDRSELYNLSGQCQNYILSLGACRVPEANLFTGYNQDNLNCRRYLENINYRGCFERHQNDADFFSRQLMVWINHQILDPLHDRLRLIDLKGNVVSEYNY